MAEIIVFGDIMIDRYLSGDIKRISQEAPVPIVANVIEDYKLGGAGNVAMNIASLGKTCQLFGMLGQDTNGQIFKKIVKKQKLISAYFIDDARPTTTKTRIISDGQQILRIDNECTKSISDKLINIKQLIKKFDKSAKIIIISDYAKGLVTKDMVKEIIAWSRDNNVLTMVDPKGNDYKKYNKAFMIKPNKKEAEVASQMKIKTYEDARIAAEKIHKKYKIQNILITLSGNGCYFYNKNINKAFDAETSEVKDVSGAGDTVISCIAVLISQNIEWESSIKLSMKAASSVVKKQGVALVTQEDLKSKEEKLGNTNISTLLSKIKDLKKDNKKIIFTNGCFDILHIGHLDYLAKSKLLGDFLIVGLNSDKSVKSLKGPKRPFNNQNDRAYFLEKLEMVDAVVVFDETNPKKLLSKIKPDVLTKADDYKFEDIIGKEHAKNVILIKKKYNTSSTKILEKININK